MLVSNGVLRHVYQTASDAPFPLGRHMELDARSLAYTIESGLFGKPPAIRPAEWLSGLSNLNQGRIGSCTGNAGTYALAALYGSNLSAVKFDGLGLTSYDAAGNEKFALALYHEATVKDGFPGTYPPSDGGSSGLGVCKALKAAGLIQAYTWSTSLYGLGIMLQRRGVLLGTPWFNAWFEPDVNGFVDTGGWQQSGVAGGHEIYVEALETWDDRNPSKSVIRFRNSWREWGDHGAGRMKLSTYVSLRQQMDAKQYIPRAAG